MCGIAGLIDRRIGSEDLSHTANAMAEALAHRGPDDSGIWIEEGRGIAFAHRRLSIIDLSAAGHQPMASTGGQFVITYNGEVYNHVEIRRDLEATGTTFFGNSDTEVILAAIEQWGLRTAIERFVGMFAFALWDKNRQELTLVRDRLGIKPLFWGHFGPLFLFGSELKALQVVLGWPRRIDRNALAAYMRWNYVPSPHSIYEGVNKLPPGHILSIGPDGVPRLDCWWDARGETIAAMARRRESGDAEILSSFRGVLGEAVRSRMIADVPLGAFLSGGIDSSLVVALMQENSWKPIRTFTIGFNEDGYDESKFARAVAQKLGTDHTELFVESNTARDLIPKLPYIYDEPFADSSQIPAFLVSEMTQRKVTVALSGDGGDELFAGYTRYQWADMMERIFGGFPHFVRSSMSGAISAVPSALWECGARLLPHKYRPARISERARKFAAFLGEKSPQGIYRLQHTHWPDPSAIVPGAMEPQGLTWDSTLADDYPSFVERMQLMDTLTYLPDDILTKVDRASMAVSLEVRVPLLDHRVVEFAWSLPDHFRVRAGQGKWLMRELLSSYIPRELIDRPKKGFSIPMAAWLRGPLREWAEDLLSAKNLESQGLIAAAPVRSEWTSFLNGQNASQEALWGVLMFQAWCKKWGNSA